MNNGPWGAALTTEFIPFLEQVSDGWAGDGTVSVAGVVARAQVPTNQLHFSFTDAPGGTTTTSDTALAPGAIVTTVTMYNALSGLNPVDLHGAVGSGVANPGVASTARSLDFSPDIISTQTNQPANSKAVPPFVLVGGSAEDQGQSCQWQRQRGVSGWQNDAALANLGSGGSIGPFVATIWVNLNCAIPAGETVCPRIWILNQTFGTAQGLDTGGAGAPGSLGLKWQQNNQVAFSSGTANPTLLGTLPSGTFPTNTWMFFAVVYDSTNYFIYYGTPTSSPQQIGKVAIANATYSMGASGTLVFGNRHTAATYNTRGLDGWENDFRFYANGYGNAAFVGSIWASAIGNPPIITSSYPDGTLLLQGTNTFTFNAISPVGANITNATLQLNALNASSQLTIVTNGTSGTSSNLTFSFANLQPNQTYTAAITLQDANGSIAPASVTFDTFYATNFTWEAEEFDATTNAVTPQYFIDNPLYTATNAFDIDGNPTSYYQLDSIEGIDTHKGAGNPATSATDYRTAGALAPGPYKTQTPASGDVNRQKFIDAAVGDPGVVEHIVGNWATAEWQNYTKTFPTGKYNIYGRLSSSAAATITLDEVTSGWGTSSQTLTNIGTFNFNSGGMSNYAYVPLQVGLGNLVSVNLAGTNTLRLTSGGGANANFYMLVPANTNLPSITGVNPSGAVLFQPTNTLVFTASSAAGISTNSIAVTVNGINVSNLLVFSGSSVSWNVSYPFLKTNNDYAVVIHVTDANGNSASSTLNIDTYAPVFTWEAEDFDFGGGLYIDNPLPTTTPNTAANSYCERVSAPGVIGQPGIDAFSTTAGGGPQVSAGDYRESDIIACTPNFDSSRLLFLTNNAQDYALGFLQSGWWENYTKTFPSGTYNVYGRMARGQAPAVVIDADLITKGWGTTIQFTKPLGTFTVQNGGWSSFVNAPLMDKYGNYANVTLNGTNTIRTTELGAVNINFYMLTAARTDLPRIDNVSPDGSVLMQGTNTFSFTASSPISGVSTNNIRMTLNGINISSNLVFSGSSASWNVSYSGLVPNTGYSAVITMTDNVSQAHSPVTVSFDTFNPTSFTWEAEDFDFDPALGPFPGANALRFIDNPVLADANSEATNAYFGQAGVSDTDYSSFFQSIIGTYVYRSSDFVSTEVTSDGLRQKYLNAQFAANDTGIVDYDINHLGSSGWINYTRTFPSGNFNLYARVSAGNGAFSLQCAQVTSGAGTSIQTSNVLGNFVGTGASFATWQYVPLVNTNTGLPVVLALGGVETLQMMGDTNENANFFVLVPASATVNTNPATANFTFTVTGGGGGGGGGSKTLNFSWASDHLGWQLYTQIQLA